jgi:methylmalonyl-CoA/ethylmalonyl-CoA epimerase
MKIKRVEHIAIAVRNIEDMMKMFQDKFGLELEYTEEINQTKLAMYPVGETYVELLQGKIPSTRTAQWIEKKGQGIFHICFEVDDIRAALAELKAKNMKLMNDEPITGHANSLIAFIDPESTGDILIELVELSKTNSGHPAPAA